MRKIKIFLLISALCLFCGCSEAEPGARLIRLGAGITDAVGLSDIEQPEKASIYLAEKREVDFDAVAKELLKERTWIKQEKTESAGDSTKKFYFAQTKPDEKGRAEILSVTPEEANIVYSMAVVTPEEEVERYVYDLEQESGACGDQALEYYHTTLRMPENLEKSEGCRQAEKIAENYMKQLNVANYRLDAIVEFFDTNESSTDCFMIWEQVIDDIPVSALEITEGLSSGRRSVYNSEQDFNHEISQVGTFGEGTRLALHVTNGELTSLDVCLVEPTEAYDTRHIVPAEKAFRFVENLYKNKESAANPRLEVAELQYKCLEQDGQIYFYPVWVFGIAEYDDAWAQSDKNGKWRNQWMETGDYYYYYIIDAFNGELLLDPKLE